VKNGWHLLQISTDRSSFVEPVLKVSPQAQRTVASPYFGWMSFFMMITPLKTLPKVSIAIERKKIKSFLNILSVFASLGMQKILFYLPKRLVDMVV
jgi:hypothetical protein